MKRYSVTSPVEAEVRPITGYLAAEEYVLTGGWQEPEYDHRPWAVLASCKVTFHFGKKVRSKIIKARHTFIAEPNVDQVEDAFPACVADIVAQLMEHGITLPPDHPTTFDAASLDSLTAP